MIQKDKRIDDYILKSADFAKPILKHLRSLIHSACPNVEETIKWGFPHFDYRGMMCSMAAFKQHCAFGFWKTALMKDAKEMISQNEYAMGHMGKIRNLKDLPPDKKIIEWVKEAMRLNDDDVKLPERKKRDNKKEIEIPEILQNALLKNKTAATTFNNFSPSHKREYIEWIDEAKTDETKSKRIVTTIEWLKEGKARNWKYERK
ncbi:MAG TPA: YdeI/OmpD-associated family protein [Ginsengibacter sp.]